MARVSGLEKKEAPWHLRWFYGMMRLRNQFSEEQLMQLAAQIAFENYRARWNRLFNVESDHLYHSERSEESLIISSTARQSKSQRYFASLNMTGKRNTPNPNH